MNKRIRNLAKAAGFALVIITLIVLAISIPVVVFATAETVCGKMCANAAISLLAFYTGLFILWVERTDW